MTFKEQATLDLPTFLNVDEFADTVVIDGEEVACLLEQADKEHTHDGVIDQGFTLRMRAVDIHTVPVVDQRLAYRRDGEQDREATVVNVIEEQGMLILRLRWFDS